ncbi:MAG TPA: energy transducer TonB [Candidatus Dormibacteraeota bacterium]|nr:energy transducer TonB [Candidatus Dormibacteraeota bacterium]
MTTMISDQQTNTTTMGVGFSANRHRAPNPEAWKRAIGTRPVAARLALLPEGKSRLNRIGLSAILQIAIIGFVVLIPLLYPERIKTVLHLEMVSLPQPVTEIPVAPPPPKIRPKVTPPPKPVVVEPVKLNPKQPHIFITQKALQPEIKKVEVKPLELKPVLEAAKIDTATNQPKRPREDVKTNVLNTGSAAPATVVAPVNKVQTGGFGDPNGLPGKGDPNKSTSINRKGLPTLPGGPGYGNGTGGDKGIRGTVASTGFGNGVANPPAGGGKRGSVQTSGFGDQSVNTDAPKKKAAAAENATTPVDILDKPRPQYTAEGRNLKLEGDVVLDLIFLANGTVQINRVINGLGHGLDEAAQRAAQQIKFKPAKREGQPVDFPARVRIEFRMAY